MYPDIYKICEELVLKFDEIPDERKFQLGRISEYIDLKIKQGFPARLMYVCTHNSRRSQFGQVWAATASKFYEIENIQVFSGGTEVTSFNKNALNALKYLGFIIKPENSNSNQIYTVSFGESESIDCFSKMFNDKTNPQNEFAAIMTCSEAEENCPFVPGTDFRIATTYDDPKVFDESPLREQKYIDRCLQIGLETLYVFSQLSEN